jgi:hypothetical protein
MFLPSNLTLTVCYGLYYPFHFWLSQGWQPLTERLVHEAIHQGPIFLKGDGVFGWGLGGTRDKLPELSQKQPCKDQKLNFERHQDFRMLMSDWN